MAVDIVTKSIDNIISVDIGRCTDKSIVLIRFRTAKNTIQTKAVNPDRAFSLCCKIGNMFEIARLQSHFPDIDALAEDSEAFRWSCKYGHINVVRYLCENFGNRISVSARDNYALRSSCLNGHVAVVRLLINNYVDQIDLGVRDKMCFRRSCHNGNYEIVKLLISAGKQAIAFGNIQVMISVCRNKWLDIMELLVDSLVTVNEHLSRLLLQITCDNGWVHIVRAILVSSVDHRCYLADRAFTYSYKNRQYQIFNIIITEFIDSISPGVVNSVFGNVECLIPYMMKSSAQYRSIELIVSKFRNVITPETYGLVFTHACTEQVECLIDLFATDLFDKISTEVCDAIVTNAIGSDSGWWDDTTERFISKFGCKISNSVCDWVFQTACSNLDMMLVTACLDYIPSKINIKAMPMNVRYFGLQETRAAISIIKNSEVNSVDLGCAIRSNWRSEELMNVISEYCQDSFSKENLNTALTMLYQWIHSNPKKKKIPTASIKLLLQNFDNRINHRCTATLLSLPTTVLYGLVFVDKVKELIDAYKHKPLVAKAIDKLDPNHDNTRYVLLDYRTRVIKADMQ